MTWGLAYALLAALPAAVSLACALGAPAGHLVLGGRWPGRMPPAGRAAAAAQAALLAAMATAMALPGTPGWLGWTIAGIAGLSLVANAVSPSPAERRLWTPVAAAMLATALLSLLTGAGAP